MRRVYTEEEKIEVLKLVEANDFNYYKTSKATGIHQSTIKKWADKMGKEVWNRERRKEIIQKIEDRLAERKELFATQAFDLKIKFVQRLETMLEGENNMDNITKALKLLHEISDPNSDVDEAVKRGGNFFQIVNNQLIQHGGKNHTAGGN